MKQFRQPDMHGKSSLHQALEDRRSPEGRAQAVLARSILEMWDPAHYLPDPFLPTVAELAALRSPEELAVAHWKVLRTLYRLAPNGAGHDPRPIPDPAHAYLKDIVHYLCSVGAGIQVTAAEEKAPTYRKPDRYASLERHWRDAVDVMANLIYVLDTGISFAHLPHREVIECYVDHHYISDDPENQKLPPPGMMGSWKEFCALICRPTVIGVLADRGVDFRDQPSPQVLDIKRRGYEDVELRIAEAQRPLYRHMAQRARDFRSADFKDYFKAFCIVSMDENAYRESAAAMSALRTLEASEMTTAILSKVMSQKVQAGKEAEPGQGLGDGGKKSPAGGRPLRG